MREVSRSQGDWRCGIGLRGIDSAGAGLVCSSLNKYLLNEDVPVIQERRACDPGWNVAGEESSWF